MNERSQANSGRDSDAYPPTISIYQNPDHVDGLLQQAYQAPLITGEGRENRREQTTQGETGGSGGGKAKVKGSVPSLGSIEAGISADFNRRRQEGDIHVGATESSWVYTRAYYLHLVRAYLRNNGLLKAVAGKGDVAELQVGDFVEYQATFTPNQVAALLDILTPELVAKVTRSMVQAKLIEGFDEWHDFEAREGHVAKMERHIAAADEVARAITNAVRVDFRTDKTREFYGTVGTGDEAVTVITICDNDHFTMSDEDRILDGHFTVLGKVSAPATEDLPILDRNKVLDRLNPAAVDAMVDTINQALTAQGTRLTSKINTDADRGDPNGDAIADDANYGDDKQGRTPLDDLNPSDYLRLHLESRVRGISIKVVPIAIYV